MTSRKTAFGFCASLVWAGLLSTLPVAPARAQPSYPVVQGKYYKFQKIADGVYYATAEFNGTSFPFGSNPFFGANLVVIVNKDDVVLVDSATTPRAARALVADVKLLTDKPIRTVVNTHWHYDHTDGNSIFGPEVQIIAHEYVRQQLLTFDILHNDPFKTSTVTAGPALIVANAGLAGEVAAAVGPVTVRPPQPPQFPGL